MTNNSQDPPIKSKQEQFYDLIIKSKKFTGLPDYQTFHRKMQDDLVRKEFYDLIIKSNKVTGLPDYKRFTEFWKPTSNQEKERIPIKSSQEKVYDRIKGRVTSLPDYETFYHKMQDDSVREEFYNRVKGDVTFLPDYERFTEFWKQPPKQEKERNPIKSLWETAKNTFKYQIPSALKSGAAALDSPENRGRLLNFVTSQGSPQRMIYNKVTEQPFDKVFSQEQVNSTRKRLLGSAYKDQQNFQKAQKDITMTLGQIDDPVDAINYVFSNIGQTTAQILPSLITAGGSSVGQEIGLIYMDQIEKIAQKKGITPEEVIDRELDDRASAIAWGAFSGSLDAVGAGRVASVFGKKKLIQSLREKSKNFFSEATKNYAKGPGVEGLTEGAQGLIQQMGSSKGAGDSTLEAFHGVDWRSVGEEGFAGLTGASGLHVAGATYNKFFKNPVSSDVKDTGKKAAEDISNLQQGLNSFDLESQTRTGTIEKPIGFEANIDAPIQDQIQTLNEAKQDLQERRKVAEKSNEDTTLFDMAIGRIDKKIRGLESIELSELGDAEEQSVSSKINDNLAFNSRLLNLLESKKAQRIQEGNQDVSDIDKKVLDIKEAITNLQQDKLLQDAYDEQQLKLSQMKPITIGRYGDKDVKIEGWDSFSGDVYINVDGEQKIVQKELITDIQEFSPEEEYLALGNELLEPPSNRIVDQDLDIVGQDEPKPIQNLDGDFIYPEQEGYEEAVRATQPREVTIGSGRRIQKVQLQPKQEGLFEVSMVTGVQDGEPVPRPIDELTDEEKQKIANQLNKQLKSRGLNAFTKLTDPNDDFSTLSIQVAKPKKKTTLQQEATTEPTSKDNDYEIQINDNKISLLNANGEEVGVQSKYYQPKITEFFTKAAKSYDNIPRYTDNNPDVTEANFLTEIAKGSDNALELAEAYLEALSQQELDKDVSNKTIAIAYDLASSRIPSSDLKGRGLDNMLAFANYAAKNADTDIAQRAEYLTDQVGTEITVDDILDFIKEHPNGPKKVLNEKSETLTAIEDRFKEVTGASITKTLAQSMTNANTEAIRATAQPTKDLPITNEGIEQTPIDTFIQDEDLTIEGLAEIEQLLIQEGVSQNEIEQLKEAEPRIIGEAIENIESQAEIADSEEQAFQALTKFFENVSKPTGTTKLKTPNSKEIDSSQAANPKETTSGSTLQDEPLIDEDSKEEAGTGEATVSPDSSNAKQFQPVTKTAKKTDILKNKEDVKAKKTDILTKKPPKTMFGITSVKRYEQNQSIYNDEAYAFISERLKKKGDMCHKPFRLMTNFKRTIIEKITDDIYLVFDGYVDKIEYSEFWEIKAYTGKKENASINTKHELIKWFGFEISTNPNSDANRKIASNVAYFTKEAGEKALKKPPKTVTSKKEDTPKETKPKVDSNVLEGGENNTTFTKEASEEALKKLREKLGSNSDIVGEPKRGYLNDEAKETITIAGTNEEIGFVSEARKEYNSGRATKKGSTDRGRGKVSDTEQYFGEGVKPRYWKTITQFTPTNVFELSTGKKAIESPYDVAHLMRALEDEAVEHFFALYIDERGNAFPHHVSTGGTNAIVVEPKTIVAGVKMFNAKKVYILHNHPSGTMAPSDADKILTEKIKESIGDVELVHIIMDTYKGEFITFWDDAAGGYMGDGNYEVKNRHDVSLLAEYVNNDHTFDVVRFSKRIYNQDVIRDDLFEDIQVTSPDKAASFFHSHRYSVGDKLEVLLTDTSLKPVAIYAVPDFKTTDEVFDFTKNIVALHGADRVIYGGRQENKHVDFKELSSKMKSLGVPITDVILVDTSEKNYSNYTSLMSSGLIREEATSYGNNNSSKPLDPELLQLGIQVGGYFIESGTTDFKSWSDQMVEATSTKIKPYLKSIYNALRYYPRIDTSGFTSQVDIDDNAVEKKAEISLENTTLKNDTEISKLGEKDVTTTSNNLESDSTATTTTNELGQEDVQSNRRESRTSPPKGSQDLIQAGLFEQSDSSLANTSAPLPGTSGHTKIYTDPREPGISKSTTRTIGASRGIKDSDSRISLKRRKSEEILAPSNEDGIQVPTETSEARRLRLQSEAENIPVHLGDPKNVRDTLPMLFPEQQDDVIKAETRFQIPSTFNTPTTGMLFTNGTGTGKTYTGLGIAKRFHKQGKTDILIVVPTDTKAKDWIEDARDLYMPLRQLKNTKDGGRAKEMVVTTYANFRANEALNTRDFDLILYDESHKLMSAQGGDRTASFNRHLYVANAPSELKTKARHRIIGLNPYEKLGADTVKELTDEKRAKILSEYEEKERQKEKEIDQFADSLYDTTKVVFLSATPFSYHFNLDYADGFLYQIQEGIKRTHHGYNQGYARDQFYMRNFGYRMRYNRLTQPEADVDSSIMERAFHTNMEEKGAVSTRMLEVEHDYSRDFFLVDDEIGSEIDRGLNILWETRNADGKQVFEKLNEYIRKEFTWVRKNQLLESIKAKRAIPHIREHLKRGRKVVLFHTYKGHDPRHPFDFERIPPPTMKVEEGESTLYDEVQTFINSYPEIVNLDLSGLINPVQTILSEFGDRAKAFNGDISKQDKLQNIHDFNKDNGDVDILIVNMEAGKEGISLHDRTGIHNRVMMNLGLPYKPTDAIQTEGRVYRVGQKSNAIFEYPVLHLNFEKIAFADKINKRVKTAENLSLGENARNLETSFKEGYTLAQTELNYDSQGTGGKEVDRSFNEIDDYTRAKTYYFGRQKRNSKSKSREGKDYFATPEPIGMKMVEFLELKSNESALEPSAGHGAIARFFPENTNNTFVEPSYTLSAQLAMNVKGTVKHSVFEELHIINKFHGIAMNPPFGRGGKLAMEHIDKAFSHLYDGGRIVAIIPNGSSMSKRLDKWFEDEKGRGNNAYLTMDIQLPSVTFARAGTSVNTRLVIIEKVNDLENIEGHISPTQTLELNYIQDINELFDVMQDISAPNKVVLKEPEKKVNEEKPLLKLTDILTKSTDTPVFRGDKTSIIRDHLKNLIKDWKIKDSIIIVDRTEDLPHRLRLRVEQESKLIPGVYYDGKVFLLSHNISGIKNAEKTLAHEVIGHLGVRGLINNLSHSKNDFENRLANLANNVHARFKNDPLYKEIVERYRLDPDNFQDDRVEVAQEYIAHLAEQRKEPSLVKKFINWVEDLLKALGFQNKMTRNDIHNLIKDAQKYVENNANIIKDGKVVEQPLFKKIDILQEVPHQYQKKGDKFLRLIQDKDIDIKRIQEGVVKDGGTITDDSDMYADSTLHLGRIEEQKEYFENTFKKPLEEELNKLYNEKGVKYEDVWDYLYAKHAPERNEYLFGKNPVNGKAQSGKTDQWAAETIQRLKKERVYETIERLAKERIYPIYDHILETQQNTGLISQKRYEKLKNQFEYYVPLRGFKELINIDPTVKSVDYEMKGRTSEAGDILAYTMAMADTAIIQGEKNRLKQAVLKFAIENYKRSDLFSIQNVYWKKTGQKDDDGKDIYIPIFNPNPKEVLHESVKRYLDMENEHGAWYETDAGGNPFWRSNVRVMVDGRAVNIKFHTPHIPQAINNIGVKEAFPFLNMPMNLLRKIHTQYNPEFIGVNPIRDVETAVINLGIDFDTPTAIKITNPARLAKAWKAVKNYYRKGNFEGEFGEAFDSFRKHGGISGWWQLNQVHEHTKNLKSMMQSNPFGENGIKDLKKVVKATGHFLDDYNRASENLVRVSTFKYLLDNKVINKSTRKAYTPKQAALYAKDLTVNFNRKGLLGDRMGSVFLFFNATVQGTARQVQPFFSDDKRTQSRAFATPLIMGLTSYAYNEAIRLLMGEDEDGEWIYDKISDWTRKNNILIPNLLSDEPRDTFKSPLPYGYNGYWAAGDIVSRIIRGVEPLDDGLLSLISTFSYSFNPMGSGIPSVITPLFEVKTNRNFAGMPIKPEPFPFAPEEPQSQYYYDDVSNWAKSIAIFLNKASGGDTVTSGVVDVSPEMLDYGVEVLGGGVARFIDGVITTAANVVLDFNGEDDFTLEDDIYDIPFVRRFYSIVGKNKDRSRFFEHSKEIKNAVHKYKKYVETDPDKAIDYYKQHNTLINMDVYLKTVQKQLRYYKKNLRLIETIDDVKARSFEKTITDAMHELMVSFNKMYNQSVKQKSLSDFIR